MAQFGCGGSRCTCQVTAGPGVTVTGNGSSSTPYVIGANGGGTVTCDQVRPCISAGDGASYDPATGVVAARPSTDPGNALGFGTDGGLLVPPAASTVVQAADTPTVDTTVSGTGTAADPYVVESAVIVAPEPNGLEATADGLLVAPSADTGNQLIMGSDGRLMVPPDAPLEIGCGLQGDGTTAAPLAAYPVAGAQAWTDDWACDPATYSTLKCDPGSGALWTPPEHYSASETIYVEHFVGGWASPIGPTNGWAIISTGAVWQFNFPAAFLGNNCRRWTYDTSATGIWDINYTSTAVFELGYVYSWNGGPTTVRPLWGLLTAPGAARRERDNGTMHEYGWGLDPLVPHNIVGWPAVRVVAGSLTINSWVTDARYHTTTMND